MIVFLIYFTCVWKRWEISIKFWNLLLWLVNKFFVIHKIWILFLGFTVLVNSILVYLLVKCFQIVKVSRQKQILLVDRVLLLVSFADVLCVSDLRLSFVNLDHFIRVINCFDLYSINYQRSIVKIIVIRDGQWLFEFLIISSSIFLWTSFEMDGASLQWACSVKVIVIGQFLLGYHFRNSQFLLADNIVKVTYLTKMSHLRRVGTVGGLVLLWYPIANACTLIWCLTWPSVMIDLDTVLLCLSKPLFVDLIFCLILHISNTLEFLSIKRIRDLAFYIETILM